MRPGELDERITLQAPTLVADGGGGSTVTWSDLATVWAKVVARQGGERMEDGRISAETATDFTLRNRTDIDERMRIVWRGVTYNVRSILREGPRPLYVRIEADRGAADIE